MQNKTLQKLLQDNPLLLPGGLAVAIILLIYAALALADYHAEQKQQWQQQQANRQALASLPALAFWEQRLTHANQKLTQKIQTCYQVASPAQGAAAFRRDIEQLASDFGFKRNAVTLSDPIYIDSLDDLVTYQAEVSATSTDLASRLDYWQLLSQHQPNITVKELTLSLLERGSIRLLLSACVSVEAG